MFGENLGNFCFSLFFATLLHYRILSGRIQEHNAQIPTPSFTLGHNEFSDMTPEEFARHFKLGPHAQGVPKDVPAEELATSRKLFDQEVPSGVGLPDYVNWIQEGAVTPVKNQGSCGSCCK